MPALYTFCRMKRSLLTGNIPIKFSHAHSIHLCTSVRIIQVNARELCIHVQTRDTCSLASTVNHIHHCAVGRAPQTETLYSCWSKGQTRERVARNTYLLHTRSGYNWSNFNCYTVCTIDHSRMDAQRSEFHWFNAEPSSLMMKVAGWNSMLSYNYTA